MAGLDVGDLEEREEAADDGQDVVGHVLALGAAHEQGRAFVRPDGPVVRVFVREIGHVVQSAGEGAQRDAEAEMPSFGIGRGRATDQVCQEKLPDG